MSFLNDVQAIEQKVRASMSEGAVTPYYELDLDQVYTIMNAALASEIVCVLRYKQHYYMSTSLHQETLQALFKEHWMDEEAHLERIADRIKQLGGVPDFAPEGLTTRAFSNFEKGHSIADMLKEDLVAERVVIKIYGDVVNFFGTKDPVTRRLFEDLLADEQDHADELADLLYTVDPSTGKPDEELVDDSEFKKVVSAN